MLFMQYLVVPAIILWVSLNKLASVEFPGGGVLDAIIAKVSGNLATAILTSIRSNTFFLLDLFLGFAVFCFLYDLKKEGFLSAILGSFILASLLNYVFLLVLGGLGLYRPLPLFLVSLAILAYLVPRGSMRSFRCIFKEAPINYEQLLLILLVFLLGLTPYKLLTYAYPVTLWRDITPNHISPAQMAVSFGKYVPLNDYPSSTYSRAKNLPGITALYSFTCAFSDVNVYKTITPLVVILFPILIVSVYLLAKKFIGVNASPWACLFFLFSGTYLRLGDIRGTSISFIYVAAALIYLTEYLSGDRKKMYLSAVSTGLCFMVNPLIACILVLVQVFVFASFSILTRKPAVMAYCLFFFSLAFITGSIYFYQISVDTGYQKFFLLGLLTSVMGFIVSLRNTGFTVKSGNINILFIIFFLALTCVFFFYPTKDGGQMYLRLSNNFPLIAYLGALGLLTLFFRRGDSVGVIFIYAIVLAAGSIYFFLGQFYSMLNFSPHIVLFFVEMDHKVDYWATFFLGFLSAGFAGFILQKLKGDYTRLVLTSVVLFLVISPYSIKGDDIGLGRKLAGQGENKVSEFWMVAASWIADENRYWHPRQPSPLQLEVIAKVNDLIAAGEIGYYDTVLNINPVFGYLEELPSFTGVRELRVVSEHTPNRWGTGESIHNISELDVILAGGAPEFVLFTVDSISDDVRNRLNALYVTVWVSSDGVVYLGERR